MASEIFQLRTALEQSQLSEADKVQRLSDEVARLSTLAVDERALREDVMSERGEIEAQLFDERAMALQEKRLREVEGLQRLELEAQLLADRERIAQLEAAHHQLREETSAQLAVAEVQMAGERDRVAALEAERTQLLDRVEEERRVATKSRELLSLAQDRMASVFAVFSGEAPKANGHHAAVTAEATNGSVKPEAEAIPVV